jgi:hypothetical protein
MIPGFSDTSSSFPMANELILQINDFYKTNFQDVFFDFLTHQLNIEGIVYFTQTAFQHAFNGIEDYFTPVA